MPSRTLESLEQLIDALLKTPFCPHVCAVNGKPLSLMRIEIPVEIDDHLEWLAAQTLFPKIYWENPQENMKVAAIGKALELDQVPTISKEGGVRFFGGQDFADRKRNTWGDFPSCSYVLPLIEMEERDGVNFLCINRTTKNLSVHLKHEKRLPETSPSIGRLDSPSFSVWQRHIREILGLISEDLMTKVVLARCTQLRFEEKISPYSILKEMQGKSPLATLFAFQHRTDQAFIGASPETLYRRKGYKVWSAAVAGTRPRGDTPDRDLHLREELEGSAKEQHECRVVKRSIENALVPLCTKLQTSEQDILETATVQHLCYTITGTLKEGVSDQDLLTALHPTPAVAGYPKNAALSEIQKREHFDRGWYAAPVGWITHQEAHHIVAIRSALIEKNQLRLFSAAGIVKGSSPLSEWTELEQKISQYFFRGN